MVDADSDPTTAVNLIFEDATSKIQGLFDGGEKHRDVGELLLQLQASVKAGKVNRKDGSVVNEDSADYKEFIESDMAKIELFAIKHADDFYEAIDEMEYMEEFKDPVLIEKEFKIYHKIGEKQGKMIMVMKFPASLKTMSALFVETDLIHHWMEGAADGTSMELYKDPTKFIFGGHFEVPVPTQGTYAMDFQSVTYLDKKTNGILQVSGSMDTTKKWFGQEPFPKKVADAKEMKLDRMFRYVEKVDDETCKHVIISEFPLAEGMTKEVIIEHMLKGRGIARIRQMEETFHKVKPLYEERIAAKPDVYNRIQEIFDAEE